MILHKGERFTIESRGNVAVKSDGTVSREIPLFRERDAMAIAGEIDEHSAWRLLRDLASQAKDTKTAVIPSHVLIDGQGFRLSDWSEGRDKRFEAPEGYDPVWAIGATTFFIFLGCHVFHGLGGAGQSASTPVPVMRRELPRLSRLVGQCLAFSPAERPSLAEIESEAERNLQHLDSQPPEQNKLKRKKEVIDIDEAWPEEMI